MKIYIILISVLFTQITFAKLPTPKQFFCQIREWTKDESKNIDEYRKLEFFVPLLKPGSTSIEIDSELFATFRYKFIADWVDLKLMSVSIDGLNKNLNKHLQSGAEFKNMEEMTFVSDWETSNDSKVITQRQIACLTDLDGTLESHRHTSHRLNAFADKLQLERKVSR